MIDAGTLIDRRYEVLERVGSGGMADVYLCEDRLLGRRVAVKVLHHRFAEDQEFVERFRREASSAAGLSHPNVVGVFDRGAWDGTYYIAMEYLPGRTLKEIVRDGGALPPATAIDVVLQICRAARFAHRRGVIHRDLKPHNVILDEEGRAKVTDFGIARAGASDMTLTGSIMGTAQYLSPEQAQGHAVTAGSDLYAIGVVLYELLVGRVPFDGETAVTIALQHISSVAAPPSAINPAVPPALDAIVMKAMAKDPASRYSSADQLIAELEAVRSTLPEPPDEHVLAAGPGALAMFGPAYGQTAAAPEGAPPGTGMPPSASTPSPAGDSSAGATNGGAHPVAQSATGSMIAAARDGDGRDGGAPPGAEHEPGSRWRRRALRWGSPPLAAGLAAVVVLLLVPSTMVSVPNVTGKARAVAAAALVRAGLNVSVAQARSAHVPRGHVVTETPNAGADVKRHTTVTIVISTGRGTAVVPEVAGLPVEEALARVHNVGLRTKRQERSSGTFKAGAVIGTEPGEGETLPSGTEVTLLVSTGPERVLVPRLKGDSLAEAEAALEHAGLALGKVREQSSNSAAAGTVLDQEPGADARRSPGSLVALTIAGSGSGSGSSSRRVSVPSVLNRPQAVAIQAMRNASLNPEVVSETVTSPHLVGAVVKQRPAPGISVKPHTAVRLFVGVAQSTSTTTTSRTSSSATTTQGAAQTSTTTATSTAAAAPAGK